MAKLCGPTVIQDQVCVTSDKVITHFDYGPAVRLNSDNEKTVIKDHLQQLQMSYCSYIALYSYHTGWVKITIY